MATSTAPVAVSALTQLMVEAYDESAVRIPSKGFQSFFARNNPIPTFVTDSRSFSYDIVRHGKKISKLLTRNDAARSLGSVQKANVAMKYQNSSFVFPTITETASADWEQTLERVAGEQAYGSLRREDRFRLLLVRDALEALKRAFGRVEKMSAESLTLGTITLDDTALSAYSFDRATNNTFAAGTVWTDGAALPLDDLDTLAQRIAQNSGMAPNFVVMGRDAHAGFLNNTNVKGYADNRRYYFMEAGPAGTIGALPPNLAWMVEAGFVHTGNVRTPDGRDFPIFVYLEQYQTDAGTWTDYMDPKGVFMGNSDARLDRYFGPSLTIPPSAAEQQAMMSKIGINVTTGMVMPALGMGVADPMMFNWDFDTPSGAQTSVFLRAHTSPLYIPTAVDAFGKITAVVA